MAGALIDECAPGDLILADRVCEPGGETFDCDPTLRARAERALAGAGQPARSGGCLGVDVVLESEAKKRAAARESGAVIVQMEDHRWAARAARWGVPVLSLRVVLDTVDHHIPEVAMAFPWRGAGVGDVVRALAPRPWEIPALLRLRRAQERATAVLAAALSLVAETLVAAEGPTAGPETS